METNIEYNGWTLIINEETILVKKDGEHRMYDLDEIVEVEHEDEYVTLRLADGGFYQVKFEDDNFLVIDLYDNEGEFIDTIGNHVFGE